MKNMYDIIITIHDLFGNERTLVREHADEIFGLSKDYILFLGNENELILNAKKEFKDEDDLISWAKEAHRIIWDILESETEVLISAVPLARVSYTTLAYTMAELDYENVKADTEDDKEILNKFFEQHPNLKKYFKV